MTVKELIELLQELPQDLEVGYSTGDWGGYHTPSPAVTESNWLASADLGLGDAKQFVEL